MERETPDAVKVKAKDFNLTGKDFDDVYSEVGDGAINSHLTDGKHVAFNCSNCAKLLAKVWITQPSFQMTSKITANCPYCGDKSFEKQVEGAFHLEHTDDTTIDHTEQGMDTDENGRLVQTVVLDVKVG
jgi:DNA-directed RNA polymerase subunit RPC12/RpoP